MTQTSRELIEIVASDLMQNPTENQVRHAITSLEIALNKIKIEEILEAVA
jgi:hypothetical protein